MSRCLGSQPEPHLPSLGRRVPECVSAASFQGVDGGVEVLVVALVLSRYGLGQGKCREAGRSVGVALLWGFPPQTDHV